MTDNILEYGKNDGAKRVTVTGWVDKDGNFFGENEHLARWSGCTHIKCDCGNLTEKQWTACKECRNKKSIEKFKSFQVVDWDRETPICLYDSDEYFFDEESLDDYCEEHGCNKKDLMLVLCKASERQVLEPKEFLADDTHEDWEPSIEIIKAADAFNEAVKKDTNKTFFPTNIAVRV